MRIAWIALAAIAAASLSPASVQARGGKAQPRVVIDVDKSQQRMLVSVDGRPTYAFDVSTGRDNFSTPNGVYAPQHLARSWFSSKYYNSPMPNSIFFHKGYAIHGSNEISKLGGPASHGCVRLHPQHAAMLFDLVQAAGPKRTSIVISGETALASARRRPRDLVLEEPLRRRRGEFDEAVIRRGEIVEAGEGWGDWGRPIRARQRR